MRTKNRLSLMIIGTAMLLTACDVKDPIYETEHPDKARITVTTTWQGIDQGIKPAEYYAAYGREELKAAQDTYTFPNLLDPGSYTMYFYNKPDGLAIGGTTATAAYTSPIGWLFTGKLVETVDADMEYNFTVPMKQQVRALTLVITPEGGTADKIESITASLSGVAGTLDIDNDTHGLPSNVALSFTKITEGMDAGKWSATVRLLGVAGSEQKLTGTITFTGGSPGDMPLESDLSTKLAQFNTNKKEPLVLGGQTVETPTGAGFTATITDWTKVTGNGTAN